MGTDDEGRVTRRGAIVAGLVGAAGLASTMNHGEAQAGPKDGRATAKGTRMPVVYLPHGGGPWPFVQTGIGDKSELDGLAAYLRSIRQLPPTPPKALLVVSAHWEEAQPTVMTGERPPMLYDYYGFPPESYSITWPAPGAPVVAARVRHLLDAAGFKSAANGERGFDHGTFVPLKLAFPEAAIPTVQLSLQEGLDPETHLAVGRALAPLRDEGVFIVGSGMTFHNMRAFRDGTGRSTSETFDAWLGETVKLPAAERDRRLARWSSAPAGRLAHPREEHLLPLMVVAGAAGEDVGSITFSGMTLGVRVSGYQFG